MMCRSCATAAEPTEIPADLERPDHGLSRRGLLAGLGLGVLAVNLSVGASTAAAATAKNGAWADPALGRFPAGGHYGAPRGGASHAGQDVSNSVGTAVYAAAGGTVVRRSWGGGLPGRTGNALVISHGNNQYTYYGHLNAYRVGLNAEVSAGQRIADMGATGNVTGPHLHFETHSGRLGTTVNPVSFLAARGVDLSGGWSRIDPGASGATVVVIQHLMAGAATGWPPTGSTAPCPSRRSSGSSAPRGWWPTARSDRPPGPRSCTRCGRARAGPTSGPCRPR